MTNPPLTPTVRRASAGPGGGRGTPAPPHCRGGPQEVPVPSWDRPHAPGGCAELPGSLQGRAAAGGWLGLLIVLFWG